MDDTTFRVLDTLSRSLGRTFSINELTKEMVEEHGTAYYANIYGKLHAMSEEDLIKLTKVGRASVVALNFDSYALIDLLAEVELRRKRSLLRDRTELQALFADAEIHCRDLASSMIAVRPESNIKLNRAELLLLLHGSGEDIDARKGAMGVVTVVQKLQGTHSLKIDSLALSRGEFSHLLRSEERNPLKEMLSDKIAFFSPQAFWMEVRDVQEGGRVAFEREETNPAKIAEQDITYNLARFGYREFGPEVRQERKICVEYIVTSILLGGDMRRVEAVPVILAKSKFNHGILAFLAQKYRVSERLLGLLRVLERVKPTDEAEAAIKILESFRVEEIKADEDSIRKKMVLYNAT